MPRTASKQFSQYECENLSDAAVPPRSRNGVSTHQAEPAAAFRASSAALTASSTAAAASAAPTHPTVAATASPSPPLAAAVRSSRAASTRSQARSYSSFAGSRIRRSAGRRRGGRPGLEKADDPPRPPQHLVTIDAEDLGDLLAARPVGQQRHDR